MLVASLVLTAALSTPTAFQQALNVLPQTSEVQQAKIYTEEEKAAQKEIVKMCGALEDTNVAAYLRYPTINIEKIYADYHEQYEVPYRELKDILVRLNDIKEYVPEEYLDDIDPKNNPTDTAAHVQERLKLCREIQEETEHNYEAAQEEAAQQDKLLAGRASGLTKASGVNYYNGRTETYYSSKVLYHYRTSEWLLDEEGFYRTTSGYYVVAASDMPQGTVFEGSKGLCCVLDSGCAEGTTDYYVCW